MKNISPEYAAFLAREAKTECTCWIATRTDATVIAATDLDRDLVFEGVTYLADHGFTATDIETSSELNVDNMEVQGFLLDGPAINEADVRAGLWDLARIRIFRVNYEDLTMGSISERFGTIGEITIERGQFKSELRGLMQAYSRVIGRIDAPSCNAIFGDSRCTFNTASVTVLGSLTRVSSDGTTLYDVGRREPGPTGAVAISGISNANPGVVTLATSATFTQGETVTIAGVIGPASVNAVTVVRNPTATSFELSVDTSDTTDYPPYVSGGTATPVDATGYFDFGVITFLSGLNIGLSMEVKSYLPGQISLQLPLPYPPMEGDLYSMVAGCDKNMPTCRDRYNNIVNFRGFPYLPGTDKIVQVGRRDSTCDDDDLSGSGGGSSGGGGGGTGGTSGGGTGGGGGSGAGGGGIGTGGGTNGGGTVDPGGGGTVAPGDTLQNVDAVFLNLPQVGSHGYPSAYYVSSAGAVDDKLSGYAIYKSFDGGTTFPNYVLFGGGQTNTMGVASTILGDGVIGDAHDTTNTVTVVIGPGGGTLTSDATAHSYVNYKNLILIGNEIIQFNTATPAGANTYVLSNLWRGCYGTEYAITGHGASEIAVFINAYNDGYVQTADGIVYSGLLESWDPVSPIGTPTYDDIGNPYTYKVVGAGKHLADASPITFTNTGESMRPICPYAIVGTRASGNLTIAWQQRFWLNGGWVSSFDGSVPAGWNANFATTHTVTIYTDNTYSTVKRSLTASGNTNNVLYSAAQQTADLGSPQTTVYITIIETWTYTPAGGPLMFSSHSIRRAL